MKKVKIINKTILTFFVKVFSFIFPMLANISCNRKTRKKLQDTKGILKDAENENGVDLSSIVLEELIKRYDDTMRVKDKLEDKAKTNVVSVSISITLIMGASKFLSAVNEKFCRYPFISWLNFALFIISVSYMLIAGIFVVKMLIGENKKYVIALDKIVEGGNALREEYSIRIAQNQYANIIRNNYVFTSYECIRNALLCLFISLVFVAIPL